jgi:hypothetical protein
MSNTLNQVIAGGSASGTLTTPGTNIVCTGQFASNTTSGSLLIAVCFGKVTVNSGSVSPSLSISTPGVTWASGSLAAWGTSNPKGEVQIFYAQNAGSVLSSTATSCQYTNLVGTGNGSAVTEITLYEVAGALLVGSIINISQSQQLKSGGTVTTGTPSPLANEFLIATYAGDGGGLTNGAAFVLGPNPSALGGGSQYIVNTAGGSQSAAFVGGPLTNWSALTVGFKTQPITNTGFTGASLFGF